MDAVEPGYHADPPFRPGDFARIVLAGSGSPPRARARDQQADLAGEAIRREILNRLIIMDPDPGQLEEALLSIVAGLGEPAGPTRGVCTAIRQEWEMARIRPEYWDFLVGQALARDDSGPGRRRDRRRD
jgi:hypothetical protein